jgi:hypothetical protein
MLDFLIACLTFVSLATLCLVIAAELERFIRGR